MTGHPIKPGSQAGSSQTPPDSSRIEELRRMLRADPSDDLLHAMLGAELLSDRRWEEAATAFRQALKLNPLYSAGWRDLGKALHLAGRQDEAVLVLEEGIPVARERGDLQAVREMEVWLKRAREGGAEGEGR